MCAVQFTEYLCKMQFTEIIHANNSGPSARPMMQKDAFSISDPFRTYLQLYGRDVALPILYSDLTNYSYADALKDKKGKWTHWENAVYETDQLKVISAGLIKTYQLIKNKTAAVLQADYQVERIDFCEYGNSIPFRIKIVDSANGQFDFFYIKLADASRVYGLELEHLLTEHPINFLCHQNTLVEEHIEGIPGDNFFQKNKALTKADEKAIAKAFIRFSASCFLRLLGDMRCYNFVMNSVSENELTRYVIRAIDFDQQCYEGRRSFYFPQLYKENAAYVTMVLKNLDNAEIEQIQKAELAATASRIENCRKQLIKLLNSMVQDELSENYKIGLLRSELNEYFTTLQFSSCNTMGAIVKEQLKQGLLGHLKSSFFE